MYLLNCAEFLFAEEISTVVAVDVLPTCGELKADEGAICALSSTEFSSPFQVTPLFRSLAAGIPSPQFSESVSYFAFDSASKA